jgi:hypothetical protein
MPHEIRHLFVGWPDRHEILHFEYNQSIRALLEAGRSAKRALAYPGAVNFLWHCGMLLEDLTSPFDDWYDSNEFIIFSDSKTDVPERWCPECSGLT